MNPTAEKQVLKRNIALALEELSIENLELLREFADFLRSRSETAAQTGRVVQMGGLWQGYAFSAEEIAAARQEMWSSLGEDADE
ncbi:MAG: hypothetical protein IPM76_00175 [Chloroflexi bacterium]|nr:hypothetical protein [Chloroflexota bacterium]